MRKWLEAMQKGGAQRCNSPHSVHRVCTNNRKIDAHEGHDVGICNILGDFLSADMEKYLKMVTVWEPSGTDGKNCAQNIQKACDI